MNQIASSDKKQNPAFSKGNRDQKVLIEFVSANPNSPITASSARGGVIGDVIGNILGELGCSVSREFYINDALNTSQMQLFGRSLEVRYLQGLGHETEMPEDGYQAEYVTHLAKRITDSKGEQYIHLAKDERLALFTQLGEQEMLVIQRQDLSRIGIEFDNWFSERTLYETGKVEAALSFLKERNLAYESEGALWLRTTDFGDELNRPLVRDNGNPTYIASDTAYHADKFERGFDRLINVWSPQHKRYVNRTKAAIAALGHDPKELDIVIHQPVQVFSGSQTVTMTSRKGEHILLSELIDEIGSDAVRFFLLSKPVDEIIELDLELIAQATADNPLHSVRQAVLRMETILEEASGSEIEAELNPKHETEIRLTNLCQGWTDVLNAAADSLEPHLIWAYATQLSSGFHAFYAKCRIFEDDRASTKGRVALVKVVNDTLNKVLAVLKVSAKPGQ